MPILAAGSLKTGPVPALVHWDLWLDPVQTDLPYNPIFHPRRRRGFYDFGNGITGDWFSHICDGPVWILDLYEAVTVEVLDKAVAPQGFAPDWSIIRWDFSHRADKVPCSLYWYNGGDEPEMPPNWDWEKPTRLPENPPCEGLAPSGKGTAKPLIWMNAPTTRVSSTGRTCEDCKDPLCPSRSIRGWKGDQ